MAETIPPVDIAPPAEAAPPDCMIVSSNRENDLQPYCTRLYHSDPDTWSVIFPWQFPQQGNRGREEMRKLEEDFLRQYFSDHEIHMQGGAKGKGAGFRFLKQVWYCIAIWNLEYRVPAFTDWWLAKPSSIELLNDSNMQPFLFREDVQVSTFFPDEKDEYGEDFLRVVIPYLQKTARDMLDKQQSEKKPSLVIDTASASVDSLVQGTPEVDSKPAPSALSQTCSDVIPPTQYKQLAPKTIQTPMSAPSVVAHNAAPPASVAQGQQAQLPQTQNYPFKQSKDDDRHFKKRSNSHIQNQHPSTFDERNAQMYYSPPLVDPSSMPMHTHPRVPSGGPQDFLPTVPQGQPLHAMSYQGRFMPPQFGPYGGVMHNPPGAFDMKHPTGLQQYPRHPPFADRSNQQNGMRAFGAEHQPQYVHEPFKNRGSHRRNSQEQRGGKARALSFRRRGSGGRNSFSSADQTMPGMHEENRQPNFNGDWNGNAHPLKSRRGSVFHERNWRSNSDHPQTQMDGWNASGNTPPMQAFAGQMYPHSNYVSHGGPVYATRPPHEADIERIPVLDASSNQIPRYGYNINQTSFGPQILAMDQICGQDWIGERCTYANKLIVFNVPSEIDEPYIRGFFNQFGKVVSRNRNDRHGLMFVTYSEASEARNCLLRKPAFWMQSYPLKIEVPRQYWNHEFHSYLGPPKENLPGMPSDGQPQHVQAPKILKRTEESTPAANTTPTHDLDQSFTQSNNTTPTPSGANTPNKTKKKPQRKNKGKGQGQDDLRKASITAKLEQHVPKLSAGTHPAGSTQQAANREDEYSPSSDHGISNREAGAEASSLQKERSASEQTEHQTSSEPSFSPIECMRTNLPSTVAETPKIRDETDVDEVRQSDAEETGLQTATEPEFTPTVTTRLPAYDGQSQQPFRETAPTEEKKIEVGDIDGAPAVTSVLVKDAPTPSKSEDDQIEDSFHTASGSPDTVRGIEVVKEGSVITMEHKQPDAEDRKDVVEAPAAMECSPSTDTTKHISIVLPSNVAIGADASKTPGMLQIPQRSTSGDSAALPTPAFVTAPNTPAVLNASPIVEVNTKDSPNVEEMSAVVNRSADEDVRAQASSDPNTAVAEGLSEEQSGKSGDPESNKSDKAKGPAQTESFSLFGKKREKKEKPKGGKKGTVKGKPAELGASSEAGSDTASRTASVSEMPATGQSTQTKKKPSSANKGGESMERTDSKLSSKGNKVNSAKKDTKTSQDIERAIAHDLVSPPRPSREETTPSKRKGITGFLSGIFSGGQQSLPKPKVEPTPLAVPSTLTFKKAQDLQLDHLLETDTRALEEVNTDTAGVGADGSETAHNTVEKDEHGPETKNDSTHNDPQLKLDTHLDTQQESAPETSAADVGLGISNAEVESPADAAALSKGKAKKKRKPKRKTSDRQTEEQTQEPAPGSSSPTDKATPLSPMFRFGEGSSPADVKDDASDVSSQTLGRHTPSSDLQSPTASNVSKKLPFKAKSGVVEAKDPRWKTKRPQRTISSRASERVEEDDEACEVAEDKMEIDNEGHKPKILVVEKNDEGNLELIEYRTFKQPEKLYVYVGEGPRGEAEPRKQADVVELNGDEDGDDSPEIGVSKEMVQELGTVHGRDGAVDLKRGTENAQLLLGTLFNMTNDGQQERGENESRGEGK